MIVDNYECRQALVFRAETVRYPGPNTGETHLNLAGIQFIGGLHVIVRFSVHRSQESHLIHMLREHWEYLRNVHPALAVFAELKRAWHEGAGVPLANDNLALAGQRLAGILLERRLGVEGIEMADTAAHEQGNHTRGARREVRLARGIR